jgi:hypothetical protein
VCGALTVEAETLMKRFIAELSVLMPEAMVETAKDLLRQAIGATQSTIADLSAKKDVSEKSLSALKGNLENLSNKRDELTPVIASLQSEINTLIKRFLSDFSGHIPNVVWESSESALAELFSQTQNAATELTARKDADKKVLEALSTNWEAADKRKAKAVSAAQSARTLATERAANEQKLLKLRDETLSAYEAAWRDHGFSDEAEYKAGLLSESELAKLGKQISDYEKTGERLIRDLTRLGNETVGKERPEVERLRVEAEKVNSESKALN